MIERKPKLLDPGLRDVGPGVGARCPRQGRVRRQECAGRLVHLVARRGQGGRPGSVSVRADATRWRRLGRSERRRPGPARRRGGSLALPSCGKRGRGGPIPHPQRGRGPARGRTRAAAGDGRPLRVKLGIDPTAPDIHLGHTVVLRKLREFQDLGHTVVLIIGDYTAPRGGPERPLATRPVLSGEEIDANAETYQRRCSRCSTPSGPRSGATASGSTCRWRSCSAWRARPRSRSCWSATTSRSATRAGEPISILELLYPLIQGYDSVAVKADVELGGTDQKFNLLLGRDIQIAYGAAPVDPDHAHPARASTACSGCPSRWATTWGLPSRRRRCSAS